MNREELVSDIIGLISELIEPEETLTLDSKSEDFEEWDSLAQVDIITLVEEKFEVSISIKEALALNSVSRLVDFVESHQSE